MAIFDDLGRYKNLIAVQVEQGITASLGSWGYNSTVGYDKVYRYPTSPILQKMKAFPIGIITVNDWTSEYLDSCTNKTVYNFSFWTIVHAKAKAIQKGWAKLEALTQEVTGYFEQNQYLLNSEQIVVIIRPISGSFQLADYDGDNFYLASEIVLQLEVTKDVSP